MFPNEVRGGVKILSKFEIFHYCGPSAKFQIFADL